MAVSDFNLEKLTTKDLEKHLFSSIEIGENVAIFGRRGSGKTEIAKQTIAKFGAKEVYLNLSVLERVDLGGYPNVMQMASTDTKKEKFVDFLLPQFYDAMVNGNTKVVCLLDEVDKADPSLWAPLLEFTQFKSMNGRKLPNLHAVIMTGNLISEGGSRPSLPLLDRAEKYLVEPDVKSWLDWAGKSGLVHPAITAYIYDNPKDLYGAVDPEERYGDASPRGWVRASRILFQGENLEWDTDLLNKKVSGCVGKEVGIRYYSYYAFYRNLLPIVDKLFKGEDVLAQYKKQKPTEQIVLAMMACQRFATLLDEMTPESLKKHKEKSKIPTYVGKFLTGIPIENTVLSVRSQLGIDRVSKYDLDEAPEFDKIFTQIRKEFFNI